ncbi:PH domain-containing protein [Alkalihalobacillus sp. AL-G]|uniref:PH domain-containing protein n=1 Tax=Alkalihalobacillus sp. AL-G TaxID=2926399 RepID=UPI00272D5857|nr:PH domain-containing protein [Alkalihalobacillus sp. AL-G]WLD93135.1 PH domain-containing protein [Alkalihalobacillus sp. AL-G]
MFGKVASDVLGISDVGKVIKPQDYDKVDSDDYVMHEDDEKIYFLIKSKSDEYCFTNKALIHVDGTSAASKKRTLRRFDYRHNKFSNVELETAGTMDRDVEIKFKMGEVIHSIDVHKQHLEELKDLYKALLKIAEITRDNETYFNYARQSLDYASSTLSNSRSEESKLSDEFKQINETAFAWLVDNKDKYSIKDFGSIFERYINN